MGPVMVAALLTLRGRRRLARIAVQPITDDVVVKLLRPQQAPVRLPNDAAFLVTDARGNARGMELVGLAAAFCKDALAGWTRKRPLAFLSCTQAQRKHGL